MSNSIALAVTRQDHPSDPAEQEIAAVERHGDRVHVVLDDGVVLIFNAAELAAAASPETHRAQEAA